MVYRFSWIAGIAAIALAFWELTALLRPSPSGTPWQIAILVATLLGAGITWTAIAYRAHAVVVVLVNVVAFVLTTGLLVAVETLWVIFPTAETVDTVGFELERALDIIRYGVEPVRPLPGLVMLLAALFWTLGFLLVAGLLHNRPFVAVLTPLIVALQFVIIDRRPETLFHLAVFVGVVAFALLAIRLDERDSGSGRLQRVDATAPPSRRPAPAIVVLVLVTVLVSVTTVAIAGDRVPTEGLVPWRQASGFTDGYSGSVSYNPFTDIRGGLNKATSTPLFFADIEGADPATVRFRTVTLDVFSGNRWRTDRVLAYPLDEGEWLVGGQEYLGDTVDVTATISIANLAQPWMPAPATPYDAETTRDDLGAVKVRRLDGSLILQGDRTYEGMTYRVDSAMPRYDGRSVASLMLADDGSISPLFAAARSEGETLPEPVDTSVVERELPDEEFWLELPVDELGGSAFTRYADRIVGDVETNFEKGLVLESWFRSSGEFFYDDAVPDQFTTDDVLTWLTDDEALGEYVRTGYCEQFATAMALLARAVGVPSRVVLGFTPGDVFNDERVLVTDKNAHAWVELWVPRFGWMAFDPTPRRRFAAPTANEVLAEQLDFAPVAYLDAIDTGDLVDTGGGQAGPLIPNREGPTGQPPIGGGEDVASGFTLPSWVPFATVAAVILAIIALAAPVAKWWRRRRLARRLASGDIAAAWEDIVDRLADLREPVDPAATPLEAARGIDTAFIPLAEAYGASLYGEQDATTAVIDRASDARLRAEQHLSTRYSRAERLRATYRPSRLIGRWRGLMRRLGGRR